MNIDLSYTETREELLEIVDSCRNLPGALPDAIFDLIEFTVRQLPVNFRATVKVEASFGLIPTMISPIVVKLAVTPA